MAIKTRAEIVVKVKIATAPVTNTTRQATSWCRLWEKLLSKSEGNVMPKIPHPPEETSNNPQGAGQ